MLDNVQKDNNCMMIAAMKQKQNMDTESWTAIMKFQNYFLLLWKRQVVYSEHSNDSWK
jgi:hypothetical protein